MPEGGREGVSQIVPREGRTAGSAKDPLKAALLDDPSCALPQPIRVQLVARGECWDSLRSEPAVKNTDAPYGQFKDKADYAAAGAG